MTKADSDSDGGENLTGSRLQRFQKYLFVARYLPSAAQAKNNVFIFMIFSSDIIIYVDAICFSDNETS